MGVLSTVLDSTPFCNRPQPMLGTENDRIVRREPSGMGFDKYHTVRFERNNGT